MSRADSIRQTASIASRAAGSAHPFALRVLGGLRPQPLLLLAQLGRELLAEIVGLEDLPDLDLGASVEGRALEPLQGLVHRLDLPDPEAGDQLLRLGEGPVDDRPLLAREADPLALRLGASPSPASMTPALTSSSLKLPIAASSSCARHDPRLGLLGRLHDHHDSHRNLSCLVSFPDAGDSGRLYPSVDQRVTRSTGPNRAAHAPPP